MVPHATKQLSQTSSKQSPVQEFGDQYPEGGGMGAPGPRGPYMSFSF